MTTVYITREALNNGIEVRETVTNLTGATSDLVKEVYIVEPNRVDWYAENGEWHRTRREAVIKARLMRAKRIASLEKQLAKLRAMTFEVEE